ncbi:transposase [Kitasatospora sp. NPDC048540]|uniref:transposase n=1 Tax=Kitasatospora sp. NPDC048540 TaxID=3155634 RepID=UPI00340DB302
MIRRHELSDVEWQVLSRLLPRAGTGRPRADDRVVLNGIVWKLRTGSAWRGVPERCGSWQSLYTRFRRWALDGTFARMLRSIQAEKDAAGDIDWLVSVDFTIARPLLRLLGWFADAPVPLGILRPMTLAPVLTHPAFGTAPTGHGLQVGARAVTVGTVRLSVEGLRAFGLLHTMGPDRTFAFKDTYAAVDPTVAQAQRDAWTEGPDREVDLPGKAVELLHDWAAHARGVDVDEDEAAAFQDPAGAGDGAAPLRRPGCRAGPLRLAGAGHVVRRGGVVGVGGAAGTGWPGDGEWPPGLPFGQRLAADGGVRHQGEGAGPAAAAVAAIRHAGQPARWRAAQAGP